MKLELRDRVALVCGASSGIGRAIAEGLAEEGARVAVVSRTEARIRAAAEEITARTGATVVPLVGDVADPEAPARLARETQQRLGPVEILVTNSGGPPAMPAVEARAEDLESACRLLLLPVQRFAEAVLPGMRERGWGRIIAVTSIAVREPQPGLVLSNALRAAVTGYLKSVSDEVARDGITVNSVLPGYTATERLRGLAAAKAGSSDAAEELLASWAAGNPIGRLLEPREVAHAVVFLASAAGSGLTGVALPVDGGRSRGLL